MRTFIYTFYDEDGYEVTEKEITVSNMALPQELDEYGYEEFDKLKEEYPPVANFKYEEKE